MTINKTVFLIPSAYLYASDINVVVLNWCMLARGPHYDTAARNTKEAGRSLASFLDNLIRNVHWADRQDLHVVGFSLGAQVAGIAAAHLRNGMLPRITGPFISHRIPHQVAHSSCWQAICSLICYGAQPSSA
jgi:pimeloyl-ACP methyl ester carboxylesterase